MVTIPTGKKWSQTNSGEVFGMIHASKNISFDKEGYAQLSKRPTATIYNVSNFETLVACDYLKDSSNSGYYALTAAHPFMFNLDGGTPTDLNGSGHGSDISFDGCIWQAKWYISQSSSFANYVAASTSWTTGLGSLNGGVPHPVCVWESANYLAIGDGSQVKLYDKNHTLQTTIVIPSTYQVRWLRYNHNRLYIGTKNTSGGDAVMFVCSDSTSTSAADAWPVAANWLFSGIAYKSSIAVMTSRGQLLWFNGGGWDELGNLPVYYTTYSWFQGQGYVNGRMEQRGMKTDGHLIFLNIDGFVGDNYLILEGQPSGLWVYDPNIGLTHRAGISLDKHQKITISSVNTTTDVFTAGSSFTALTGVKVWYKTGSPSTGLESYRYYYLIRVDSTHFKMAKSYANAIAGTAIDITAGGSSEELHYCDELDCGGTLSGAMEAGAVCLVSELDGNPLPTSTGFGYMTGSQVIYGASNIPSADGGSQLDLVLSLAIGYNRGYIAIQKVFSSNVRDSFRYLIGKVGRLFQVSDEVVFKWRMVDKIDYPMLVMVTDAAQATWVNGTSFTTTKDISNVADGDEVEFTAGRGNGITAHVFGLPSLSGGTYTVTLDEAVPGVTAGDKSGFVLQNWKKMKSGLDMTDPNGVYNSTIPGNPKKWVQLKIELRGHSEPILEEAGIDNQRHE